MRQLFLDNDGVLADFDQKAMEVLGLPADDYQAQHGAKQMWREIRHYEENQQGFFEVLPLMGDAMELFQAVQHLDPIILTGCPVGDWAPAQKLRWRNKHFAGTRMETCMARDKIKYIESQGDVLVDDKLKYRDLWIAGGGEFVHHRDAKSTIGELRERFPEFFS